MVQEAGLNFFRFPGGPAQRVPTNDPPSYNGRGTAATFANFIASVGGEGVVTLNYGTASPQKGAAAGVSQRERGGYDRHRHGAAVEQFGQRLCRRTGGRRATGRRSAAQPLAQNDGLNFPE